jgi:RNA polymerase sigma-70 factor, ECF subfamily
MDAETAAAATTATLAVQRELFDIPLREAFMVPDMVEAPVGDATLDLDRLETCLARLAERERMVVLLTFYAERTAGEAGKELGVKEGKVRVIRHRAVERLRTCMTSREVAQ